MLGITRKDLVFYSDFLGIMNCAHEAAHKLVLLLTEYKDVDAKINEMTEYEHKCDQMVHDTFQRMNDSFITPIDREDIHVIARYLDDIMDQIDEAAHLFQTYNIKTVKPEAVVIAKLIEKAASHLVKTIKLMPDKKSVNKMRDHIIEVNRIENQGDVIYRQEIKKLFTDETNPIDVLRWNGIFDRLEEALDACETVANVIEGVSMKHV